MSDEASPETLVVDAVIHVTSGTTILTTIAGQRIMIVADPAPVLASEGTMLLPNYVPPTPIKVEQPFIVPVPDFGPGVRGFQRVTVANFEGLAIELAGQERRRDVKPFAVTFDGVGQATVSHEGTTRSSLFALPDGLDIDLGN
jgi:hypothetical protein